MNLWQELVQLALMGTDRGRLSDAARAQLEALDVPVDAPPEQQVMEGAAILHQLRRAALEPPLHPMPLPKPVASGSTTACSPRSSHHLQLILRGEFRSALPEFIDHLLRSGRRLPPESLPVLFDQCLGDSSLWQQVQPAIGPTGKWLLSQHPAWTSLLPDADPGSWPVARHPQRLDTLRALRRTDPAQARSLLQQTWSAENYRDKLDFLLILENTLQPEDEYFLESVLDDRRKEVRLAAAELLARLPASALVDRLFRHALRFIQREKTGSLAVNLPSRLEEAWIRDGIQEKPPAEYAVGAKAGWLIQLFARIPPTRWAAHWDCSPETCLRLFAQTEWTDRFTLALTEAVARHPDPAWEEELLRFWMAHPDNASWEKPSAEPVFQRLSPQAVDRMLLPWLDRQAGRWEEQGPASKLLLLNVHPWTEQLGRQVIEGLQQWLSGTEAGYNPSAFYRRLLEIAAYRCPPSLLEQVRRGWPMQARSWSRWEEPVEQFLHTLVFRREMRAALE